MERRRGTVDAPARWGTAPWSVMPDIPPADVPRRCDVAVVGAGFTGLSAALHLAGAGLDVSVLEARRVGAGASGRTGGIALEGTAVGPLPGADHCLDALAAVIEREGIACDLRLPGCLELEHGAGATLWRDGDRGLCVAGKAEGGTLDPGALVEGLARAAMRAGATIHEGAPVRSIEEGPAARLRVGDDVIEAGHVVLAVNAYTPLVVSLSEAVHPALTLAVCVDPLDESAIDALGLSGGEPFYTIDLPYLWGRVLADGRVIFGAGLLFDETGDLCRLRLRDPEALESFALLEARVRGLHPALAQVHFTHRWGGPIAFASGRTPLLGRLPGNPRVIVTGAYAGHGVALGVRAGEMVANAILTAGPLPAWGALER